MNTRFPLDQMSVATPCKYDWHAMEGDDRVRHCAGCDRNVYNISGMTRDEAEELVLNEEGRMCVRFHRRQDGTVLTADCPVGVGAFRRWVFGLVGASTAVLFGLFGLGGFALSRMWTGRGDRVGIQVPGLVADPDPIVMGEMCAPPPVAAPPLPPPVLERPAIIDPRPIEVPGKDS